MRTALSASAARGSVASSISLVERTTIAAYVSRRSVMPSIYHADRARDGRTRKRIGAHTLQVAPDLLRQNLGPLTILLCCSWRVGGVAEDDPSYWWCGLVP